MVLRSSPVELLETPDVTHSPNTQTSQYIQRVRFLFFATVTPLLVEGCEENVKPNLPLPRITQPSEKRKEIIHPLFSEIQNDTPLTNTMVRFSSEEGDVSMGIFIEQDSLFFVIDSEDIQVPASTYRVQTIDVESQSLYDADSFLHSYGLACLSLTKTDKGMQVNILGEKTEPILKETLDTLLSKISSHDYAEQPNGHLKIHIDLANQDTYTFIVTPETTP